MKDGSVTMGSFTAAIFEAGEAIEEAEQRSLTEYIIWGSWINGLTVGSEQRTVEVACTSTGMASVSRLS